MKKLYALIAGLFGFTLVSMGQSVHFSQFYSVPLWNNPAQTGNLPGSYRLAANFRSQWMGGGSPYLTGLLSVDFRILRNHLAEGNKLGMGIALLSDQSMNGALQQNVGAFSVAYNLSLDADNINSLGLGLQGSYNKRRVDYTKFTFENQFNNIGFDQGMPVAEPLSASPRGYLDLGAGLAFNQVQETYSFFLGASAYNLLQRHQNADQQEFRLPTRYSVSGGGQTDIGYGGILYFSVNHQRLGTAKETTLGAAYGIKIGEVKKQELDIGMWYRVNDAAIPYIGYQLEGLRAGISYDYTVSALKTAGMVSNSFELSFIYQQPDNSELKRLIPWY